MGSSMFFFPPFTFSKEAALGYVCALVRRIVRVCVCVCAVFQPRGHASGVGSRYICHCLRRVASIFRRTRLALALKDRLVLSLSSVSVAPFSSSSPAISASTSPVISSDDHCAYFHHNGFYFDLNQGV